MVKQVCRQTILEQGFITRVPVLFLRHLCPAHRVRITLLFVFFSLVQYQVGSSQHKFVLGF